MCFGADIKSRFLIAGKDALSFSPALGDLREAKNYKIFKEELNKAIRNNKPNVICYDLHPGYFSHQLAKDYIKELKPKRHVPVQHHHAHIASVMFEHGLRGPVIGVSFDGAGFGLDKNIWGGEFLYVDKKGFRRLGHLKYQKMPGADKVIYQPWRMVLSILKEKGLPFLKDIKKEDKKLILKMIDKGINSPLTSSAGRLFDAAAALVGVCKFAKFEAEGPIKLEKLCNKGIDKS